ncbi:MAG: hypothetical protein WCJ39_04465 [bacterium]
MKISIFDQFYLNELQVIQRNMGILMEHNRIGEDNSASLYREKK